MVKRLPAADDFQKLKVSIVPPPGTDASTNVLLLLHGLGDRKEAFETLGRSMNLPQTVCISVQGNNRLLDLDGYHWGDDILFDSTTGGLDADAGVKASTQLLKIMIEDTLIQECGYTAREILIFGFGQGGMTALSVALALHQDGNVSSNELGGVISIGSPLPGEAPASLINKCKTPILICCGKDRSSVNPGAVDKLQRNFEFVEVSKYRRPGDSMPSNRDEMMPVMQFFARRLRSTKGVPEGSIEITL